MFRGAVRGLRAVDLLGCQARRKLQPIRCLSLSHVIRNPHGVTTEDAETLVANYLERGLGAEGNVKLYNETAFKYDEMMEVLNFSGAGHLLAGVTSVCGDNRDVSIIDIAAGTGLIGIQLHKAGFTNLDAADASQGMLEIAKSKGIYKNLYCHRIGAGELPIKDGTYDLATMSGVIGENMLPSHGLKDIIRIVKPGGYIVSVFREAGLSMPWYETGLGPFMKQLEKEGLWVEQSRMSFPKLIGDVPGLRMIHKVL